MSQISRLLRTGSLTVAWLLVLPCLLLLASAIVPVIPWLRIYAFHVVPNRAPWFVLFTLAGLVIALVAHHRHATRMTRTLAAFATAAAVLAVTVVAQFLHFAHDNGARIDLLRTLSTRNFSDAAGPDQSRIYAAPDGEPLWLDIYRPRGGDAPSPLLVVVHGGGFVEGTRRIGAANLRNYADRGWTVISLDYRLARPGRPTWNLAIRDVRCALAWTVAHAAPLNVDLSRLTLSGASAGGSLALDAAYSTAGGDYDPRCGPHLPRIAAVVVKAPLIDPAGSWRHEGEFQRLQRSYMTRYLGGSPEQVPDRYAAVDLRYKVRRGNPPTLILAGAQDPLLPIAAAQDLARRSRAAGSELRLVAFPYSGHDFNTTFDSISNQAVIQIITRFLTAHHLAPANDPER